MRHVLDFKLGPAFPPGLNAAWDAFREGAGPAPLKEIQEHASRGTTKLQQLLDEVNALKQKVALEKKAFVEDLDKSQYIAGDTVRTMRKISGKKFVTDLLERGFKQQPTFGSLPKFVKDVLEEPEPELEEDDEVEVKSEADSEADYYGYGSENSRDKDELDSDEFEQSVGVDVERIRLEQGGR